MRFNILEQGFPAVLKTPDGEILEYGKAFVSPDQQGITFKNDFVPLFKMGTPLVIVRTQGDIETQRFSGEVYLSAQNLLQIVRQSPMKCCPELLLPFCTIPVCRLRPLPHSLRRNPMGSGPSCSTVPRNRCALCRLPSQPCP